MKTIKADRFSLLTRPYSWHGRPYLSVAIYALVEQDQQGHFLQDDQRIWADLLPTLDSGGMLDHIMPKAFPEYLISGHAYTAHQSDKTACMVRAQIGELEKQLVVSGQRYWINQSITAPEPFDAMPIDWSHAFGGEKVAANPAGKGTTKVDVNGTEAIPLPNIEDPLHRIAHRQDSPEPACFGPIGLTHPDRIGMQGTYSEQWHKYEFPGFLPDMNPEIFNMARPDQQWRNRMQLPLGERFRIWNMNEQKHCWEGTLPELRARCFLKFKPTAGGNHPDGNDLVEVDNMVASTVWLLPDTLSMIVMFHGTVPIRDEEADDVAVIMGAIERQNAPRPLQHYRQIMQYRLDPEVASEHYELDEELLTADLLRPDAQDELAMQESPLADRLARFVNTQETEIKKWMQNQGLDYDDMYPPFVGPPEDFKNMSMSDRRARLTKLGEDGRVQARGVAEQAQQDTPELDEYIAQMDKYADMDETDLAQIQIDHAGPPDLSHFDMLREQAQGQGRAAQASMSVATIDQLRKNTRKSYLYTAQYQRPAVVLDEDQSTGVRQEVMRRYQLNRDLSDMDLTGADLRGIRLSGANFTDSFLEGVNFEDAQLEQIDFTRAVLTRARFARARMNRIDFTNANLAMARISDAQLRDCLFHETNTDQLSFVGTYVAQASLSSLMPEGLILHDTIFEACRFNACIITDGEARNLQLKNCDLFIVAWTESQFEGLVVQEGTFKDVSWTECRLNACSFTQCKLVNILFEEDVTLTACRFVGSRLLECNFMAVDMSSSQFTRSDLNGTDFTKSVLHDCNFDFVGARNCIFHKAELAGSSFRGADLIQATFEKAGLEGCNFDHATFFRTNVSKARIDPATRLDKAYRQQLELYPMHRDAVDMEALFGHG
ncbi:MAG: DUF2169 domain-containing protein [Advenella sp.]